MVRILYFDLKHAIIAHDMVIEVSGGKSGLHDLGLLESVVELVKNDDYYPTIYDKMTHIVFSVAMNHAFSDGNKRSSIVLGGLFLVLNGYSGRVSTFIVEMENIVLWVAQKKVDKVFLRQIIQSIIDNGELTEELKLKLLSTLEK